MSYEDALFYKETLEVVDYGFNWQNQLAGDTISASTWTLAALNGATLDLTTTSNTFGTTWTKIWLQGGLHGSMYTLTNLITTASGRTEKRSIKLLCKIL